MTNDSLTPEAGAEKLASKHLPECPCHMDMPDELECSRDCLHCNCDNLGAPLPESVGEPAGEGETGLPNDDELIKIVREVFPHDPGFLRTSWKDGIDIEVPTVNCNLFVLRVTKVLRDQLTQSRESNMRLLLKAGEQQALRIIAEADRDHWKSLAETLEEDKLASTLEQGIFWPCKEDNHAGCAKNKFVECVCPCHRRAELHEAAGGKR